MADTAGMEVPESFRLWTAITIIAGTLERRVWTRTHREELYPNFYTVLTGPPSAGKGLMIREAREYWSRIPDLFLGPDNPTPRSFWDRLEGAAKSYTNGTGATVYSAMSIACREFGVFFTDAAFFNNLTDIYDNPPQYDAPRSTVTSILIERPTVNIIVGITPDYLGDVFPESAWGQGFTSRLMLIYGTEEISPNLDVFSQGHKGYNDILLRDLIAISKTGGEFVWDEDAKAEMNSWFRAGLPIKPEYGKLYHYNSRRRPHAIKLSMISAISYTGRLTVTLADFNRAREWLLSAERLMPDIFRAMKQKSDEQLLHDLHRFVYAEWASVVHNQRKPIKEDRVWHFLAEQVPSERISRVIESAVRSRLLLQPSPGLYLPKTD